MTSICTEPDQGNMMTRAERGVTEGNSGKRQRVLRDIALIYGLPSGGQ